MEAVVDLQEEEVVTSVAPHDATCEARSSGHCVPSVSVRRRGQSALPRLMAHRLCVAECRSAQPGELSLDVAYVVVPPYL